MNKFIPDYMYERVYNIPIDKFAKSGKKLILLDIDNTLVTYDDELPTDSNMKWFEELKNIGIDIVFISNNHEDRVKKFAECAGFEYHYDVNKPSAEIHRHVMKARDLSPEQCLAVGDQVFTDVLAAHRAGIEAVMVKTIKDPSGMFIRLKRALEVPFVAMYKKKHKGEK